MKFNLPTNLLTFAAMTLMIMTVSSAGLRGLQSVSLDQSASSPSIQIAGIGQIVQALIAASEFTNATFDTITLNSWNQSLTDAGVVYEAKLTIVNDQGVSVNALVDGAYDPVSKHIVLSASTYEIETESDISSGGDVSGDDGNSTNATSPTTDANGFTPIDIAVAESDPQVNAAFLFATEQLIAIGEAQNKIPTSNYTVTNWISAAYKNNSRTVQYKFVAELLGANYVNVGANMTVFYRASNQSYSLNGYYFRASNITKGSLPNNNTNVGKNSTDVSNNSTDANNSTDVSNNSTDVNNNSTVIDNNSTVADNSTDVNNNSTVISNNSTNATNVTVVTPIVPAGYTYISSADLANNSQAQAALSWGLNALIQKAISQYKLPAASPVYNVSNLILAAYKNSKTGVTYIFNANTTNALKYKLAANVTVAYLASNQSYKLSAYSFSSSNYPKSAIVIPANNTSNGTANSTSNSTNNNTNNASAASNITAAAAAANSTVVVDNPTAAAANSTVVDNSAPAADNSTVIDSSAATTADNSTVVDSSAAAPADNSTVVDNSAATADNSTVIDPSAAVVADNSTVISNGSN